MGNIVVKEENAYYKNFSLFKKFLSSIYDISFPNGGILDLSKSKEVADNYSIELS